VLCTCPFSVIIAKYVFSLGNKIMATLKELRDVRLQKLKNLQDLGVDPYPATSFRTHLISEVISSFGKLGGKEVILAGWIMSLRRHGKLTFFDIKDFSGTIQVYIKEQNLEKVEHKNSEISYSELDLLDIGDYIECKGALVITNSGEQSIEPHSIRILAKSLRPLPDKHDGLKDRETRMRKRYLDTRINDDVRDRYIRRSKFWAAHREFFEKRGFYEINIPVLEAVPGGADANPFVTHMDSIDETLYLRISHELFLKRLIGGGYEKVYEIGPRFRNEGLSDEHLPEHMAMEVYWAYADWQSGMDFIQDLFNYVIESLYGDKKKFSIRGFEVDFSKKEWERIDFSDIMKQRYGVDVHNSSIEDLKLACEKAGIKAETENRPRLVDALWKEIRRTIGGPAFLINHPKYLSPLAKANPKDTRITERFQPIIAGSELGNGWSEINSGLDQFERFSEQQSMRDSGDSEAQWLDIDYVEMLEYGMPPTFGYGHSERVFWFLEDVTAREGVPFPQLKHVYDDANAEIYGLSKSDPLVEDSLSKTDLNESLYISSEGFLPSRKEAEALLRDHVKDSYQIQHALMIARGLEAYAEKFNEDRELWYITGLLHDLDYFEYPDEHPAKSLEWFKERNYPESLIHAVAAHAHMRTNVKPQTRLASALIAVDEMAGFLYAYALMRPEGYDGMKVSSVKKKFKDRAFAAKIDREEILYGVEQLGEGFDAHVEFLINVYKNQAK